MIVIIQFVSNGHLPITTTFLILTITKLDLGYKRYWKIADDLYLQDEFA